MRTDAWGPKRFLANVCRGGIVDEPNVPPPLLGLDTVVLLPHIAIATGHPTRSGRWAP